MIPRAEILSSICNFKKRLVSYITFQKVHFAKTSLFISLPKFFFQFHMGALVVFVYKIIIWQQCIVINNQCKYGVWTGVLFNKTFLKFFFLIINLKKLNCFSFLLFQERTSSEENKNTQKPLNLQRWCKREKKNLHKQPTFSEKHKMAPQP